MHFLINELSFIGQAENEYEANLLMMVLFELVKALKPIQGSKPISTHRMFFSCAVSPGFTVKDWAHQKSRNPKEKDIGLLFLKLTTKGPFIDEIEGIPEELNICYKCYFNETDISSSSLATAAFLNSKGALVSLQNAPDFMVEIVPVKFYINGDTYEYIKLSNLTHVTQVSKLRRLYVPSPKHAIGGWGTPMDLSDEIAQAVLDKGLFGQSKQIYGYYNGKFYEFQPDNAGGYHGYPINESEVPSSVSKQLKKI